MRITKIETQVHFPRQDDFTEFSNKSIKGVTVGCSHVFLWDDEGKVFARGEMNMHGNLGIGHYNRGAPRFVPVEELLDKNVIDVQCGKLHTLFLTDDGRVFGCGDNRNGQFALGDMRRSCDICQIDGSLDNQFITNIYTGSFFSFFQSEYDDVFACGRNWYGQLGLGDTTDRKFSERVPCLSCVDVKTIVCGTEHCMAITRDTRDVFAWGNNSSYELGDFRSDRSILIPAKVQWMSKIEISRIYCGYNRTVVLEECGLIHSLGDYSKTVQTKMQESTSSEIRRENARILAHFAGAYNRNSVKCLLSTIDKFRCNGMRWFGQSYEWSTDLVFVEQ